MAAVPEESLASLYKLSRLAFDELMKAINASNVTTASLLAFEDECSRLQLWATNIGAGQYKTSTSLDFRLRDAETIRHQLRKSLLELYDALQEACQSVKLLSQHGKMPVRFTQPSNEASPHESTMRRASTAGPRSDVDLEQTTQILTIRSDPGGQLDPTEVGHGSCEDETDDDNDPYEDLQYAFEDARSAINSLFRMTLYIRNPSRRDQLKRRDISAVSGFAVFDEAHVEHKFPSASIDLIKRLGQANTVRRANIRYWERHHRELALDETSNHAATIAPLSESVVTASKPVPQERDLADTRSHFSEGQNVRRPEIPEAGRKGARFQCPICYYIVTVSSEREWLKHVFFDLQPYVCTFPDCKTPLSLYESRGDWFNHVAANHLLEKETHELLCPMCSDDVHSLPAIRRHLALHLEEIALFSLPNSLLAQEFEGWKDVDAAVSSSDEASMETQVKTLAMPALSSDNSGKYLLAFQNGPDLFTNEVEATPARAQDDEPLERPLVLSDKKQPEGRWENRKQRRKTSDPGDLPREKAGPYSYREWNAQRAAFAQYYLTENKTLEEAAQCMRDNHGFHAKTQQWKKRVHGWGFKKYPNPKELLKIFYQLEAGDPDRNIPKFATQEIGQSSSRSGSRSRSLPRRSSSYTPAPLGSPTRTDMRCGKDESDEDYESDLPASDDERSGYRYPLRYSQERTRSAEDSDTGDLAKGLSLDPLEREAESRTTGLTLNEPSRSLEQSSGSGVNTQSIEEQLSTVSRDVDRDAPHRIHVKCADRTIIVDLALGPVNPAMATVGDLRSLVRSKIGVFPGGVTLMYGGNFLGPESHLLRWCGISNNSEVRAILTDPPHEA